jgi:hypothetical protein
MAIQTTPPAVRTPSSSACTWPSWYGMKRGASSFERTDTVLVCSALGRANQLRIVNPRILGFDRVSSLGSAWRGENSLLARYVRKQRCDNPICMPLDLLLSEHVDVAELA